jgi:dCTP deaminase
VILSGGAIVRAVQQGLITIDPFDSVRDRHRVNPASVDLTLGDEVAVYSAWSFFQNERIDPDKLETMTPPNAREIDVTDPYDTPVQCITIPPCGLVLRPGHGYLMHTRERVKTHHFVPVIDGKSSLGRLFLAVHVTAGYGDPGFDGQYTLEVVALAGPVRVYAGMRIAQMRFHTIADEHAISMYGAAARPHADGIDTEQYQGQYTGESAKGPVPSRFWKTHAADKQREEEEQKR